LSVIVLGDSDDSNEEVDMENFVEEYLYFKIKVLSGDNLYQFNNACYCDTNLHYDGRNNNNNNNNNKKRIDCTYYGFVDVKHTNMTQDGRVNIKVPRKLNQFKGKKEVIDCLIPYGRPHNNNGVISSFLIYSHIL
jgi:hypothetical protein